MSFTSMVWDAMKWLLKAFRNVFMPNKKDLIGSLLLAIPMYILFGLSLIFLLPLIIICVFIVYLIRRLWKVIVIWWTVKVIKKKTHNEVEKIKNLLK